jgi:hypothetical protein
MTGSDHGSRPPLSSGADSQRDVRRLLHDLSNDLGALRLRAGILAHVHPNDIGEHAAVIARLSAHSEELLRQVRQLLDPGPG